MWCIWEVRAGREGVGRVRKEGGNVRKGYFNEKITAVVNKSSIPLRNQQEHGLELPTEGKGSLRIYPRAPLPRKWKPASESLDGLSLSSHPGRPTLA